MSSPQVIDSSKAAAQLTQFFAAAAHEKQQRAITSALSKQIDAACGKDAGFDTTSLGAQMGRPMSRPTFQAKLLQLNRNLRFEQSRNYPDHWGIYVRDEGANLADLDLACRGRRFVCGMPDGMLTEFSVRRVKQVDGMPIFQSHAPGWRDVLQRLIKQGLISLSQAEIVFGTNRGRDSSAWHGAFYA